MRGKYLIKIFVKNKSTLFLFIRGTKLSSENYTLRINLAQLLKLSSTTSGGTLGGSFSTKRANLSLIYLERLYKLGFLN